MTQFGPLKIDFLEIPDEDFAGCSGCFPLSRLY